MSIAITIECGDIQLAGKLHDTPTGRAIAAALPLEGQVHVWGEELYFSIPVHCPPEPDAQEYVAPGTLAYWPPGHAFCIFWGPTPVSTDERPKAYSPVNLCGELENGLELLPQVREGATLRLKAAANAIR
ncbi:MAG: hypothetical protein D6730_21760 [Bacteroidetes bacterium]|nr:MAG: hypothetical protein D6730_21760 [Bacteroidota bacterium]